MKDKERETVVLTAEEIIDYASEKGVKRRLRKWMWSRRGPSAPCVLPGYFNVGHTKPGSNWRGKELSQRCAGLYRACSRRFFPGATAMPEDDPRNKIFREVCLWGSLFIEEMVAERCPLTATAYGRTVILERRWKLISPEGYERSGSLKHPERLSEYNVAVNLSEKVIYTYMGVLQPKMGNATYCSAGQLSLCSMTPLQNHRHWNPNLLGRVGYVVGNGTQHNPGVKRPRQGFLKRLQARSALPGSEDDESEMASRNFVYGIRGYPHRSIGVPIPFSMKRSFVLLRSG